MRTRVIPFSHLAKHQSPGKLDWTMPWDGGRPRAGWVASSIFPFRLASMSLLHSFREETNAPPTRYLKKKSDHTHKPLTQCKVLALKTAPALEEGEKGIEKVGNLVPFTSSSFVHHPLAYSVTKNHYPKGQSLHWELRPRVSELWFFLKLPFPTVDFVNGDIAFYLTIGPGRSHSHWGQY